MKYPPHLWTIEIYFGPEIMFKEHYHDQLKAGEVLKELKTRMFGSDGQITALKMWQGTRLLAQFMPAPTKPKWVYVPPPPDPEGVRHIPAGVSGLKRTNILDYSTAKAKKQKANGKDMSKEKSGRFKPLPPGTAMPDIEEI